MDPFAALFAHTAPAARTFFAGNLCTSARFAGSGHLHLLQRGAVLLGQGGASTRIDEPSLLFFPRGTAHKLDGDGATGADLICATVDLGHAAGNPIGAGLPEFVLLPLAGTPALGPVCDLLVAEAFHQEAGQQVALDRLFDYLLILVVRAVVARGEVSTGVLAGLADPRLARALTAMHDEPGRPWTLAMLAEVAGMSRTRFAAHFSATVGRTALDYLTGWRMTLGRQLLASGKPVKAVAGSLGYDSPAAFTRVFSRVLGQPPRAFLAEAR